MPGLAPPGVDGMEVAGLSKRFGGVQAVKDVSFVARPSEIHGLIGPNGSGKTTTFNLISGIARQDTGTIRINGRDVSSTMPHQRVRAGLARTFQQIRLFPGMTATENVMVALDASPTRRLRERIPFTPGEYKARRRAETRARSLLARVGVDNKRTQDKLAASLSFLDRHLTEIARALAVDPTVLLLDEPMTGMVASEVAVLERLMRDLRSEGMAVVLVEHHMDLVMRVCDRITVLNFGEVLAEGTPTEVAADDKVAAAYLGRPE